MKDANNMTQPYCHAGMDTHSGAFLTGMRWRMRPKPIYTPTTPYPAPPRIPSGFVGNARDGAHAGHLWWIPGPRPVGSAPRGYEVKGNGSPSRPHADTVSRRFGGSLQRHELVIHKRISSFKRSRFNLFG